MPDEKKPRLLGMILIENNVITTAQFGEALNFQDKNGGLFGEILINMGYLESDTLAKYLEIQQEMQKQ